MFRHPLRALVAVLLLAACQPAVTGTGDVSNDGMPGRANPPATATSLTDILFTEFADKNPGVPVDPADRRHAVSAERHAYDVPEDEKIIWVNSQNGDSGTVVPLRSGYAANGAYCREFEQTMTVNGLRQQDYAKACRQPDGAWKIAH